MSARFWVGSNGTWDASATAHWAATSGGAAGASAPTSSDDVTIDSNYGGGTITIAPGAVCNNLTFTGTASTNNMLQLSANFAPVGSVAINGNSVKNRLWIASSVAGTPRTITIGTLASLSNCDFTDIAGAGAAAPFGGTSLGDCLGNGGITFTPSATQTATGTASFTWSTHGWSGRVPLPQDDVVIPNAFIAGRTITADMPRLGRSLTFSCTGNPAFTGSLSNSIYGSLALAPGMTWVGNQQLILLGRGAHTITSAGVQLNAQFLIGVSGGGMSGAYTLNDAFTLLCVGGIAFQLLSAMTFNAGSFTVTITSTSTIAVRFNGAGAILNMGSSLWVLDSTAESFQYLNGTVNPGSSTIKLVNNGATNKTFTGGGKTYNNVWFATLGAGANLVTGSNTFNQFKVDAGRNIQFTAGTTQTAADFQFGDGVTIGSITAAGHTLAKSGGGAVNVNAASISRSAASPASTFYALGSTDGGNNSGWTFGAAKLVGEAGSFAIAGDANLLYHRRLVAEAGAFEIAGQAVTFAHVRNPLGAPSNGMRSSINGTSASRPPQLSVARPPQLSTGRRP